MKVTFLGQAGLLFETPDCKVMIDPYFSDSVAQTDPSKHRRIPMDDRFWEIRPDVLIFTHDHLDHYDPQTVEPLLQRHRGITILAPGTVWPKVRTLGKRNNSVLFDRHTRWTEHGIRFTAVKAQHSDPYAIGVILEYGDKRYYVTGDTLYSREVLSDLPQGIDVVFLPVNGVGNNMNFADAADFFRATGAKLAVPLHTGLFDNLDAAQFPVSEKAVPKIFQEIKL